MLSRVLIWTVFGVWKRRCTDCAWNTKSMKGSANSSCTSASVQSLRTVMAQVFGAPQA